jgi:hypothetical protein
VSLADMAKNVLTRQTPLTLAGRGGGKMCWLNTGSAMNIILKIFILMVAAVGTAHAVVLFEATMTTSQEPVLVGPTTAAGAPRATPFGTASFVLNDAMNALSFTATVFNIDFTGTQTADVNDNLLNAHIHGGPLTPPTFTTRAVVWGFFGTPFNDINSPGAGLSPASDCTPFATGVGGTCAGTWDASEGNGGQTLISQLPFLLSNQDYINFHTVQNPGGEIRGQIVRVPEPGSLALVACALGGIYLVTRRKAATLSV